MLMCLRVQLYCTVCMWYKKTMFLSAFMSKTFRNIHTLHSVQNIFVVVERSQLSKTAFIKNTEQNCKIV